MPFGAASIKRKTSNAVRLPNENWDQPVFEKRKQSECMIATADNPKLYLQGYFIQWSQNEVNLRIPGTFLSLSVCDKLHFSLICRTLHQGCTSHGRFQARLGQNFASL